MQGTCYYFLVRRSSDAKLFNLLLTLLGNIWIIQ
jgi:hypothetical protein